MAQYCEICGKGSIPGNYRKLLRGHYNITGKRVFKPNLQKTTVDGKKVTACVKCIKNLTKKASA